jgi:hypothetical protein
MIFWIGARKSPHDHDHKFGCYDRGPRGRVVRAGVKKLAQDDQSISRRNQRINNVLAIVLAVLTLVLAVLRDLLWRV